MAPKYSLTYFNIGGIVEPVRFILKYANVDFVDNRVEFSDWEKLKPTTPSGTLPYLEMNGKTYTQSVAIARYFARQHGLTGKNELESLECDELVDWITDVRIQVVRCHFEADEEIKRTLKEKVLNEFVPKCFKALDARLNGGKTYLVGDSVTWTDFVVAHYVEFFSACLGSDWLKPYSNVAALKGRVFNLPAIKAWVEKRPKTDL